MFLHFFLRNRCETEYPCRHKSQTNLFLHSTDFSEDGIMKMLHWYIKIVKQVKLLTTEHSFANTPYSQLDQLLTNEL